MRPRPDHRAGYVLSTSVGESVARTAIPKLELLGLRLADGSTMTVSKYVAEPGDELGGFHESRGLEFITVLEGRLRVEIDGDAEHDLGPGASVRYSSRLKHRWRQDGPVRTRFVHVITGLET